MIGESRVASHWEVQFSAPLIDVDRLRIWKNEVVGKLTGGLGLLSRQRAVRYIRGRASFLDPRTLRIEKQEGGEEKLAFVKVDSQSRTTDPDIFAIGDVSEFNGQVWAMIPPALDEARVAAKKILGQEGPEYKGTIPSNTLKVVGMDLTSVGVVRSQHEPPEAEFEEIKAMTSDGKIYKKFVIKDGKMIGAILLGTKKEAVKVTKMIKDGEPVEKIKSKLSDPSFSLA